MVVLIRVGDGGSGIFIRYTSRREGGGEDRERERESSKR